MTANISTQKLDDMDIGVPDDNSLRMFRALDMAEEERRQRSTNTPEIEAIGKVVAEMVTKVSADGITLKEISSEIVTLEDEDEEIESIPMKKMKSTNMDVDENDLLNSENKENISQQLKRMSRKDLEDLVLRKVVEGIVKHSEAGKIRTRVQELQIQKDKMFQRVGHLQKQVQELSKAVQLLLDSQNRDPNNSNPNRKRPPPLKFYRSVGLQVSIEASLRNGITKVVHVGKNYPVNGMKPPNGTNGTVKVGSSNFTTSQLNVMTTTKASPNSEALKKNQGASGFGGQSSNGISNGQKTTSPLKKIAPAPTTIKISTPPSTKVNESITTPTIVDLTDDSSGSGGATQNSTGGAANGVQSAQSPILNAQAYGIQYVVTSASGQTRPILVKQNLPITTQQQQRASQVVVLQNISPKTTTTSQPTRPTSVSNSRSTVSNFESKAPRASVGTMIRAPPPQLYTTKIQLPALPPAVALSTSVPRGRVLKELPPRPGLTLNEQADGIVLSWTMKLTSQNAEIASYQIFACQESLATSPGKVTQWKKVGDVKALPLPMACTLSQFTPGNRYFFIVRAVDGHGRSGNFCEPGPITLRRKF